MKISDFPEVIINLFEKEYSKLQKTTTSSVSTG